MTFPVVLLHGFAGDPKNFEPLSSRLGEDIPTFAPALVGHGAAAEAPAAAFEAEVDRLAGVIAARAARVHLVGYSLGGRLALGLCLRHPALFETALLIGAQPGLPTEVERAARRAEDEKWCSILQNDGISSFVDAWEALPLFETQRRLDPVVRARQRESRLACDPAGLVRSLRSTGLGVMPSYWDILRAVMIPTTLMVGSEDRKFAAIAERMNARMPRSRLLRIDRAGHNVVLEEPEAVAGAVRDALFGGSRS